MSEVFQRIYYERKLFNWKTIVHLLNKKAYTLWYLENVPLKDFPVSLWKIVRDLYPNPNTNANPGEDLLREISQEKRRRGWGVRGVGANLRGTILR